MGYRQWAMGRADARTQGRRFNRDEGDAGDMYSKRRGGELVIRRKSMLSSRGGIVLVKRRRGDLSKRAIKLIPAKFRGSTGSPP